MKAKQRITDAFVHILLGVLSVVWILPIVYIIITSFRGESGSYKTYILPKEWTLAN